MYFFGWGKNKKTLVDAQVGKSDKISVEERDEMVRDLFTTYTNKLKEVSLYYYTVYFHLLLCYYTTKFRMVKFSNYKKSSKSY